MSAMGFTGRGALMLWLDVDPALRAETDSWYAAEHLPDRVGPGGYHCARRYRAIEAAPEYLTFFVAETPDDLASPGYLGLVRQISPQSHRIRAGFRNVARNTFRFTAGHSLGVGGVALALRSSGGDLAPLVTELAARQGVVAVHAMQAAPEVRRRMDAVRVTGLDDGWTGDCLLVEGLQAEDLRALRDGPLATAALAARGIREEEYGLYMLQHHLAYKP
jgi:hypothetical protein